MKAFTYVLVILLVFSIDIGNERLMKGTECVSKNCTETLANTGNINLCGSSNGHQCEDSCKKYYGWNATGSCNDINCVCQYSCFNF
ncbi:hypothetical protein HN51_067153 [Arachis hypogaea]